MKRNGMWGAAAASLAVVGPAAVGIGCGGGASSAGSPDATVVATAPELNVAGGAATSPGGQGQPGGNVHLLATGDITLDATVSATPPSVPQVPADATTVDAAALAADVSAPGSAVISGDVTTSGGG